MVSDTLQIGDKIQIDRFFYKHVGIYLGPQPDGKCVIHNDKKSGVVMLSTLEDFSSGQKYSILQKASGNFFERQAIIDRAISLLGKKYDLVNFNCEHFASFAQTGRPESPQLAGALVLASIAIFFAIVSD